MADLLLPVASYSGLSSWAAHQRRSPKSTEPGTDLYVPIGTPVVSPADGVVYGYGESIIPATGRWVGVNFDNGMSFRAMHFSKVVRRSGRVSRGEVIGYSGASGYGEEDWSWNVAETGGAHVHVTLWPDRNRGFGYDRNGRPFTVDFMNYVGGSPAAVDATPIQQKEWYEMALDDQAKADIRAIVKDEVAQIRTDTAGLTTSVAKIAATVDTIRDTVVNYINPRVKVLFEVTRIKVHGVWARTLGRDPKLGLGEEQIAELEAVEGKPNEQS